MADKIKTFLQKSAIYTKQVVLGTRLTLHLLVADKVYLVFTAQGVIFLQGSEKH
jgi:hypothetical protein